MTQFVEFLAMGMGAPRDASGNVIIPGTQGSAPPDATPAPVPDSQSAPAPATAAPSAPAAPVAPVKATTPTASIPEPPVVGQASPDDTAAQLKKTLLGG